MTDGTGKDGTGKPLEVLAVQFSREGCRAVLHGGTLLVSRGARHEHVVACDGRHFRWGGETGRVFGEVGYEAAAAERAARLLRQLARWS